MQDNPKNGFVYAASGEEYSQLALISARSLREFCPLAQIDFFTDCDVGPNHPFDRVVPLTRSWFRPKFEALPESRFDRTVYIDADAMVVADISDLFVVLEHHEFCAAPVIRNNRPDNCRIWKTKLPLSVPRYNCGLIGIQNTPKVVQFMRQAEDIMIAENLDHDQSMMRERLFQSDIRVVTLPYEYNCNEITYIDLLSNEFSAPRVLHFAEIRDHPSHGATAKQLLGKVLGPERMAFLEKHRQNDASQGATELVEMPSKCTLRMHENWGKGGQSSASA